MYSCVTKRNNTNFYLQYATQSAVMPQYTSFVCPPSVCDVHVCFSHGLEYFENKFTAE